MKVKKFNNLWAMGLILCGVLLVAFYVIKIIYPEFIIGIAETPRLVEIGTKIQSNKWYLHIFNFIVNCIYGYILCCACCRTYRLNWNGKIIFLIFSIFLRLIAEFYPEYYTTMNYIYLIITPYTICAVNKTLSKDTFTSTILCFCADLFFQILSLIVRNLPLLTTKGNVITFLILLIDSLIWRIILYLFFNYKNNIKGDE